MREIVLDTETTGLNPVTGDKIVEIGCVELVNRVKTGNVFHVYVNPGREVPEEAFRIHGISTEFLKDKPSFLDISNDFVTFIGEAQLIIHNAAFDMRFINHELKTIGLDEINFSRATDTLLIARKKFPGAQATLDALCKRFGIDLSKRTKHGALLDADLLADVYIELLGGSQSSMELTQQQEVKIVHQVKKEEVKIFRPSRNFKPSAEELEQHTALLKKIKQPIWTS